LETSEKNEEMKEDAIILAPNEGELLVLQRILYAMEGSREEGQREHVFHSWCTPFKAMYVD